MNHSRVEISLLVPVYNESENLVILHREVGAALSAYSYELIFIDDGSTDASPSIIESLCQKDPQVKAVYFKKNFGQTSAFDAGFRYASGKIIVTLDSDLQNDPADIPKMIEMIRQGYDFVAGWRSPRRDGFWLRILPSLVANRIIRVVTGTSIKDLGCSLKAYRKEFTDQLKLYGEMHRFIGVSMEGMGAKVGQIVTNHRSRRYGDSKYGITRTLKVLLDLLTVWFMQRYRTKPSYVFGGLGALQIIVAGLLALFVLYEKFQLQIWVHKNPLFLVAILFAITGVQFMGFGLLAELLTRTYYEASNDRPYLVSRTIGL